MSADTWLPELQAARVFYSYADEDDVLREALEKQLSLLRRQGYIAPLHKRNISAGQAWETVTGDSLRETFSSSHR